MLQLVFQKLVQRVLALCEFHYCKFHYCDFSKKSINLPYANFGLFYFISAMFWAKIAKKLGGYQIDPHGRWCFITFMTC